LLRTEKWPAIVGGGGRGRGAATVPGCSSLDFSLRDIREKTGERWGKPKWKEKKIGQISQQTGGPRRINKCWGVSQGILLPEQKDRETGEKGTRKNENLVSTESCEERVAASINSSVI